MYSALDIVIYWLILWFGKETNKLTVAGTHEYKEKDSVTFRTVVSEVSSDVGNTVLKQTWFFYFISDFILFQILMLNDCFLRNMNTARREYNFLKQKLFLFLQIQFWFRLYPFTFFTHINSYCLLNVWTKLA